MTIEASHTHLVAKIWAKLNLVQLFSSLSYIIQKGKGAFFPSIHIEEQQPLTNHSTFVLFNFDRQFWFVWIKLKEIAFKDTII